MPRRDGAISFFADRGAIRLSVGSKKSWNRRPLTWMRLGTFGCSRGLTADYLQLLAKFMPSFFRALSPALVPPSTAPIESDISVAGAVMTRSRAGTLCDQTLNAIVFAKLEPNCALVAMCDVVTAKFGAEGEVGELHQGLTQIRKRLGTAVTPLGGPPTLSAYAIPRTRNLMIWSSAMSRQRHRQIMRMHSCVCHSGPGFSG
jgi:hypothetical protein